MDWIAQKQHLHTYLKKYRYAVLAILVGILLMSLPMDKEPVPDIQVQEPVVEPIELEQKLEKILSQVQGAGKVKVLLTQAEGEQILYQTDGDISAQQERRDTVLITNSKREETGLIRQINPPTYQGAIVLCEGAEDARVSLWMVTAVMSVTGLTSDHITVLKMK